MPRDVPYGTEILEKGVEGPWGPVCPLVGCANGRASCAVGASISVPCTTGDRLPVVRWSPDRGRVLPTEAGKKRPVPAEACSTTSAPVVLF